MKHTFRRTLALILALSVCLGLLCPGVRAADVGDSGPQSGDTSPAAPVTQDPADTTGDTSTPGDKSTTGDTSTPGDKSTTGDTSSTGSQGAAGDPSGSGQQASDEDQTKTEQEQKTLEEDDEADSKTDQESSKPAPAKPVPAKPAAATPAATAAQSEQEEESLVDLEKQCGKDLTWSMSGTTLTITGSGAMWNYDGSDREHVIPPWDDSADYVRKIDIGAEVTSLGAMAFQSCVNLEEVEFTSAATTYPNSTFWGTPWWRLAQFRKAQELAPDSSVKLHSENGDDVFAYSFAPTVTEEYRLTVAGAKGARARVSLYDEQGGVLFRARSSRLVNLVRILGTGDRVFLLVEPLGDTGAKYTLSASSTALPPLTGVCGDGLTWVLDAASETLTVSGKGKMDEYKDRSKIPWRDFAPIIAHLNVENGVTSIGRSAFADCTSLASVALPNSVESVGENAFANCTGLTEVHLSPSAQVAESAFRGTPWLFQQRLGTALSLAPDTPVQIQVDQENNAAFFRFVPEEEGLYRLESADVKLKKGQPQVSVYRQGALLVSAAAPEFRAQAGEELLVEVRASTTQKKGGTWTETLRRVVADESLGQLHWSLEGGTLTVSGEGEMVLDGTSVPWESRRGEIEQIVVENGVKSVGKGAFEYCVALKSVSLPDSVQTIDEGAFYDCPYLSQLSLGSGLKRIGAGAFNSCYGLMSLSLPDSVEDIGEYAFAECTNLKEVTMKQGLKYPKTAFSGTPWLRVASSWASAQALQAGVEKTVILNKGKPRMYFTFTPLEDGFYVFSSTSTQDSGNPIAYLYTAEGTELARDDDGGDDQDFYLGYTLRAETTYCFCAASNPDPRGKQAYSYDVGLQLVPLPASGICGPQLTWSLTEGVLTITGSGRMDNYSSAAATPWASLNDQITSVKVEAGVGTIGSFAFDGLSSLVYAELPEGVVAIGSSAFSNCPALKYLALPSSLRSLGGDVFSRMNENFVVLAEPGTLGQVYARRSGLGWKTPAQQRSEDLKNQG